VEQPPSAVLYAGEGAGSTFSSKFEISGIFASASFGNCYMGGAKVHEELP
jgi:hypothetical protein